MFAIKIVYNDGKTITLDLTNSSDKATYILATEDIAKYKEDDLQNPYAIKRIEPSQI